MPVARLAPVLLTTALLAALGATAVAPPAAAAPGEGPIRVTVVRDYDGNGSQNPGIEVHGVGGLRVSLEDAAGRVVAGVTDDAGVAVLDPTTLSGPAYRVSTTIPASLGHLRAAPAGGVHAGETTFDPLVTFVTASPTGVAVGVLQAVWNPYDFVTDGQLHLAVGLQNNGSGTTSVWDANLENPVDRTPLATFADTGSISGIAWDRFGRQLFVGSALKRHTILGPLGSGGIYVIRADGSRQPWAVLPAGTTAHDENLDEDFGVFGAVGKEGVGDLQASEDGRTLYAVNLAERTLVEFDTTAAGPDVAPIATWPIPVPPAMADRPDDWRPYGLGIRDGILYVGGVDSAESVGGTPEQRRAQLTAHVWAFDEATHAFGAAPVLSHSLDFERGAVYTQTGAVASSSDGKDNHWNAWRSQWTSFDDFSAPVPGCSPISICPNHVLMLRGPQPLLADIAIDNDGSLILGFKDRTADMFGRDAPTPDGSRHVEMMSGGDINRACLRPDGRYDWEGEGDCPNNGAAGEEVEAYPNDRSGPSLVREHREAAKGPLYMVPSRSWVGMLGTNGGSPGASHTTVWFDRQTGAQESGRIVLAGTAFGKGNGLGGVTLIADAAIPVQLGNRTWFDANRDGQQTPGEPDLPGVTVRLIDPTSGLPVDETSTDARGLYYFDDEPLGLSANKDWLVEFDYSTADLTVVPGSPTADQIEWTTALPDDPATDDVRSRADRVTGRTPVVRLAPGSVDHTLDAGVRLQMGSFDIQKLVVGPVLDADKVYTVEWTADGIAQDPFELRAGEPATRSALLPVGTEIRLSEVQPDGGLSDGDSWRAEHFTWGPPGEADPASGLTASFTIQRNPDDATSATVVGVTNTVQVNRRFQISKEVVGPVTVSQDVEFPVRIKIGDEEPFDAEISQGTPFLSKFYEIGTVVRIQELEPAVQLPDGYAWDERTLVGPNGETAGADGWLQFTLGDGDGAALVAVTNSVRRLLGGFTVTKYVSGDDGTHDGRFVINWTKDGVDQPPIEIDADETWRSPEQYPLGTVITLTEGERSTTGLPDLAAWGPARYTGSGVTQEGHTARFTIEDEGPEAVRIELTNPVTPNGTFQVSKFVDGDGAAGVTPRSFEIEYTVNGGPIQRGSVLVGVPFTPPVPIEVPATVKLREIEPEGGFADGWEAGYWGSRDYWVGPTDAGSVEVEPDADGWITFPVTNNVGVTIAVVNHTFLRQGSFDITKRVVGAADDDDLDVDFVVDYQATHPSFGTKHGSITVRAGKTARSPRFPAGTEVSLSERAPIGLPPGLEWTDGRFLDEDGDPLGLPFVIVANPTGETHQVSALEFTLENNFERPTVDIEKGDDGYQGDGVALVNDADTMADGQFYEPGERRTIVFDNRNTGTEPLTNVAVTDETVTGGSVAGLACTWPGHDEPTEGIQTVSGGWRVEWEESDSALTTPETWNVGDAFTCTATLQADGVHADIGTVFGTGAVSGTPVRDEDRYHAFTATIQVIKYDGQKPDPAVTAGAVDLVPDKPLIDADQDANDLERAVPYRAGIATPVRWVVTNASTATWLTDIDLADATNLGPAIAAWTCDLGPVDGPSNWSFTHQGTFEDGLWGPQVSFFCEGPLTLDWDQTHGDTVAVEASVVVPEETVGSVPPPPRVVDGKAVVALNDRGDPWRVSDRDDFHAKTPGLPELPRLPLPFTGANAIPAALIGVALFLLGAGGLVFAARVRRTMGRRG